MLLSGITDFNVELETTTTETTERTIATVSGNEFVISCGSLTAEILLSTF